MGGASMGRGGFSSARLDAGFRGGSSFGSASHLGSTPRFGAAFGVVCANLLFELADLSAVFTGRSSAPGTLHHRAFFGSVFSGLFRILRRYPTYYGGDFYSTPDYYPGYDYYGSSYSTPAYSAQNDKRSSNRTSIAWKMKSRVCGSNGKRRTAG